MASLGKYEFYGSSGDLIQRSLTKNISEVRLCFSRVVTSSIVMCIYPHSSHTFI